MKKKKKIPEFKSEDNERDFWAERDSTEFVDWRKAKRAVLPNLKPSVKTISLRLPESMLAELKMLANKRDVPYQSLMKMFLADHWSERRSLLENICYIESRIFLQPLLQMADRMTMAHSIEGRVPFLDVAMIEMAQRIPPELKIHGGKDSVRPVEKWILRRAVEDLLPPEILWRDKSQFDEGSGTVDLLDRLIAEVMTEDEAYEYRKRYPEARLRSAEECYYHHIFMDVFENADPVLKNVARWAERPVN